MQKDINTIVVEAIEDLKGQDIVEIDVSKKTSVADLMIVATGRSDRHVKSIAENVSLAAKRSGNQALGLEGQQTGNWVLVDLGDTLVHIMTAEAREFYSLEKLRSTTIKGED